MPVWADGMHRHGLKSLAQTLSQTLDAERDQWFLWVPVCFGTGIGLYFALPNEPSVLTAYILVAATLSLCVACRSRALFYILSIALFCTALGFANAMLRTAMVEAPRLDGGSSLVSLNAWVEHIERRHPSGYRLTLRPIELASTTLTLPEHIRITSRFKEVPPRTGQAITVRAVLRPVPEPVMPGGFDFSRKAFYAGLGAVGFAISPPALLANPPERPFPVSLRAQIDALRTGIESRISSALPEKAASMIVALITGERGRIPDETLQALRDSGLAHMLAISGMHMALMAGSLFWLVRAAAAMVPHLALKRPIKKWAAVVALIGGALYLTISGGSVATQRAFLMMAIVFLAILLNRPALTLRNVAIAACVVLAIFPESLLDVSFQMSFAAVTTLVAVYERVERRRTRSATSQSFTARLTRLSVTYMTGIALTTLVASIAIAPFAAYHFNKLAQFSLLANLAAMPVFGLLVMPAALASLMLMPIGLEWHPLQVMAYGVETITSIAETVAQWDGATIPVAVMPQISLLALVAGGLWLTLWQTQWRLLGLPIALIGALSAGNQPKPDMLIGRDGNLLAIKSESDDLMAIGITRPDYSLEQWLRAYGDPRNPSEALKGDMFRCDELACVATIAGKSVAFVHHPAALAEECSRADIVIAQMPVNRRCPNARAKIDRRDLWKEGAHALYLDGQSIRIETVANARGNRPWSRNTPKKRALSSGPAAYAGERNKTGEN